MAMLCYHDFVIQDPVTRVYRTGPALLEIGLAAVRKMDIRAQARPVLESLSAATGETVHLAALEGHDVRFLDAIESPLALRVSGRVGRLLPAHATSIGKAMLASLRDDDVLALYPGEALQSVTQKTVTSRAELQAELARVRKRGYAVNDGESEDGVSSVGVSVADRRGVLVGGLSVAAPRSRMQRSKRSTYAELLRDAADKLGESLT
jgi:IclR family transcriptional regulator, acetate operon repressor